MELYNTPIVVNLRNRFPKVYYLRKDDTNYGCCIGSLNQKCKICCKQRDNAPTDRPSVFFIVSINGLLHTCTKKYREVPLKLPDIMI